MEKTTAHDALLEAVKSLPDEAMRHFVGVVKMVAACYVDSLPVVGLLIIADADALTVMPLGADNEECLHMMSTASKVIHEVKNASKPVAMPLH